MSTIQIVPTRSPRSLKDLLDSASWREGFGAGASRMPMGGRVIRLVSPAATMWLLALAVTAPLLAVGMLGAVAMA